MSRAETTDDDRHDAQLLAAGRTDLFLARHLDRLHQRARLGLRLRGLPPGDAADVVQDAVVRFLGELERGLPAGLPPRAVLHQHLGWAVGDWLGEVMPHVVHRADTPAGDGDGDGDAAAVAVALAGADDHLGADGAVRYLSITALLDRWEGTDVIVARAIWLDGLTPAQVAEREGMTANAVHQATHRVRERLKQEGLDRVR